MRQQQALAAAGGSTVATSTGAVTAVEMIDKRMYDQLAASRQRISQKLSETNLYIKFLEQRVEQADESLVEVGRCPWGWLPGGAWGSLAAGCRVQGWWCRLRRCWCRVAWCRRLAGVAGWLACLAGRLAGRLVPTGAGARRSGAEPACGWAGIGTNAAARRGPAG
jgi:hypothetical protein